MRYISTTVVMCWSCFCSGELDSLSVSPANGWSVGRFARAHPWCAKFICMGNGAAHLNFRQIIAAEFLRGI